jgi:hypothetical protein
MLRYAKEYGYLREGPPAKLRDRRLADRQRSGS